MSFINSLLDEHDHEDKSKLKEDKEKELFKPLVGDHSNQANNHPDQTHRKSR